MIITCPSCSKRYLVDDTAISTDGRDVQCIGCENRWFFKPQRDKSDFNQVHLDLIGLKSSAEETKKPLPWSLILTPVALTLLIAMLYTQRYWLVTNVPATSGVYEVFNISTTPPSEGLELKEIESYYDKGVIHIRGKIYNKTQAMHQVPPITMQVKGPCTVAPWWSSVWSKISGGNGTCVVERWLYTPAHRIFPKETMTFETKAPTPVAHAQAVTAKF